jgi:DNA polymerase, archaea type
MKAQAGNMNTNKNSNNKVTGWLLDVYPMQDKMVLWIKQNNNNSILRLEDNWTHSIYVAADNKADLESMLFSLLDNKENKRGNNILQPLIKEYKFVSRYERIIDSTKSFVLQLTLFDSTKALTLAKRIERLGSNKFGFGGYRLYNVDILPAQAYFFEHNIFPLALCDFYYYRDKDSKNNNKLLKIVNIDNIWNTDYIVPQFRSVLLKVNARKDNKNNSKIVGHTNAINSISIKIAGSKYDSDNNRKIKIESESEKQMLDLLELEISRIDPDFIFTEDGDSFTFPYLIHRAKINGNKKLSLSRDPIILQSPTKVGTSYFSYGRVYFKPSTIRLYGRIHFDQSNSFELSNETGGGLHGLYEISRICRLPLHTAARASIGKCLSSLQCYYATRKGILIPWKPVIAEHFKTLQELSIADRGGLIYEPEVGVHEQVAEFDFESLYPNIMRKYNLSAETIECNCCAACENEDGVVGSSSSSGGGDDVGNGGNSDNHYTDSQPRVPELGYHICRTRMGIVPISLRILLEKRAMYKELKNSRFCNYDKGNNSTIRKIYDARYSILKWVLVTSFGYLGFNNAKFGRIDAHIAVCAFDRKILSDAASISEKYGCRVLHGIVDSIWIQCKNTNANITTTVNTKKKEDEYFYLKLKESIEQQTGFNISFEGLYKWIIFTSSKQNDTLPVPNRYFGSFESNSLKIRGLETRRHDTPAFFSKFQNEILEVMARGNNINEVKKLLPEVMNIFQKYAGRLKEGQVPLEELVFTKILSKDFDEYQKGRNTVENSAINLLNSEGKTMKAGELLRYVITDYYQRYSVIGAIPVELIDLDMEKTKKTTYNLIRYKELLVETCNSVIEHFGYSVSSQLDCNVVHLHE